MSNSENVLRDYIIRDIIKCSLTIYGVEHTVGVEFYKSLPAEQLVELHKSLRADYETHLTNNQANAVKNNL